MTVHRASAPHAVRHSAALATDIRMAIASGYALVAQANALPSQIHHNLLAGLDSLPDEQRNDSSRWPPEFLAAYKALGEIPVFSALLETELKVYEARLEGPAALPGKGEAESAYELSFRQEVEGGTVADSENAIARYSEDLREAIARAGGGAKGTAGSARLQLAVAQAAADRMAANLRDKRGSGLALVSSSPSSLDAAKDARDLRALRTTIAEMEDDLARHEAIQGLFRGSTDVLAGRQRELAAILAGSNDFEP